MTLPRMPRRLAASFAMLLLAVSFALPGCSKDGPASGPGPGAGTEVVGTLVALKDDRPVDGGIDLTLETAGGARELVRVPSIFRIPPRDSVQAMHEVVDASKIGDRLRARGIRDESGALLAQTLERLPY